MNWLWDCPDTCQECVTIDPLMGRITSSNPHYKPPVQLRALLSSEPSSELEIAREETTRILHITDVHSTPSGQKFLEGPSQIGDETHSKGQGSPNPLSKNRQLRGVNLAPSEDAVNAK